MKYATPTRYFIALCLFISLNSYAQTETKKPRLPKWVSDKGYWVVESNVKTPKESIVYFYSNEHLMVYKEEIKDQAIKLNRKKTLLRLKAALEEAISNHEKGSWAHQTNLVKQRL